MSEGNADHERLRAKHRTHDDCPDVRNEFLLLFNLHPKRQVSLLR